MRRCILVPRATLVSFRRHRDQKKRGLWEREWRRCRKMMFITEKINRNPKRSNTLLTATYVAWAYAWVLLETARPNFLWRRQCHSFQFKRSLACAAGGSFFPGAFFGAKSPRAKNFNLTPPHSSRGQRGFSPTKELSFRTDKAPAPASYAGVSNGPCQHLRACKHCVLFCGHE